MLGLLGSGIGVFPHVIPTRKNSHSNSQNSVALGKSRGAKNLYRGSVTMLSVG